MLVSRMNSSYESLKGGSTSEALEDFSGGVTEMFDLTQAPPNLYSIMEKAHERNSMMGCSVDVSRRIIIAEYTGWTYTNEGQADPDPGRRYFDSVCQENEPRKNCS